MAHRRDEQGYVAAVTAIFVSALFFGLAAMSVDVARWYVEIQRVQNAADAGALAGVTYMPQDLAGARAAAEAMSEDNGYPAGGTVRVTTEPGVRPSELRVTVSSEVPNMFAKFFGQDRTVISRSSVADYTGPQPMGSPCNTMGNEPNGTAAFGPIASQLSVPPGANCPRFPEYWPSITGPKVAKTQGDRFDNRYCSSGESGCEGSVNSEFDPLGYFMLVRVLPAAVGRTVNLQVYDPAYVATGSECADLPDSLRADNLNPFVADARTRYDDTANQYCTGDNPNGGSGQRDGGHIPTVTSYGLRAPTDTQNPRLATPVEGCTRQYPGYNTPSADQLDSTKGAYLQNLARVFHQWKQLCSFTPAKAGDYYLQVRANVPMDGPVNNDGSHRPSAAADSGLYSQDGDDSSVGSTGTNRFGVRAYIDGGTNAAVSVSAWERMPIFANTSSSTPVFNLIRILPGAAGKTLVFTFFDVGDAATSGTMTVLRPTEATGSNIGGCTASGYKDANLPTCSLSGISNSAGWNGQAESINVPIPSNYSCNYSSPGGCWWRVQVGFGSGSVTDATTWTAAITGDPVRLIE